MPFQSQAQRRWMYANFPKMAETMGEAHVKEPEVTEEKKEETVATITEIIEEA